MAVCHLITAQNTCHHLQEDCHTFCCLYVWSIPACLPCPLATLIRGSVIQFVRLFVCVLVCLFVCLFACLLIFFCAIEVLLHARSCMYAHAHAHARTHTCTHTHTHARTHAHTHTLRTSARGSCFVRLFSFVDVVVFLCLVVCWCGLFSACAPASQSV